MTLAKSYEPYGTLLTSTGTASSIFAYAGEQIDTTVLIYLRARYLNPRLGIFLARDPWSGDALRPGSMNGFNYVEGNPINLTDAGGQDTCPPPYHWKSVYRWSKVLNKEVFVGFRCVDDDGYPPILRDEIVIGTGELEAALKRVIEVFGAWCISQLAQELAKPLPRSGARTWADPSTFEEPISTPTPFPPPPGPEPTKEPQRKHIALGRSDVNGEPTLFRFTHKLNQALNPVNIYVYTSDEWFRARLSDTDQILVSPSGHVSIKLPHEPSIYISISRV